eukprot:scaffold10384_cov90-Skeletonema_marinoi.AAC.1
MKQCTVDKLMRIKDDVYLVAVELMGGGLKLEWWGQKFRGWSRLVPSGTGRDFRAGIRDSHPSRPETIDPGIPGILMRTWLSKARRLIEVVPSQQRDAMLKKLNNFLFYYRSTLLNGYSVPFYDDVDSGRHKCSGLVGLAAGSNWTSSVIRA